MGVVQSNLNRNPHSDFEKDDRLERCEKEMVNIIKKGTIYSNDDDDDDLD